MAVERRNHGDHLHLQTMQTLFCTCYIHVYIYCKMNMYIYLCIKAHTKATEINLSLNLFH